MIAKHLTDLLKSGDKIAVSNITGREASNVSIISQKYNNAIVGGWALGKSGGEILVDDRQKILVFGDYQELIDKLPEKKYPNKIIIYSPPEAVYGEVKNVLTVNEAKKGKVETIFIITENVSIEVSAKIYNLCSKNNIDVIGCNTLGVINATEQIRVGAVGGDQPQETFKPGSATIISNSGNMVNTIASYLYGAGIGVRFGISTGKDALILTPLKDFLALIEKDKLTKVVILYIEPGGLYELEAINWMKKNKFSKPIIVYISGILADEKKISLGHAGAVVEGIGTSAKEKMKLFDDYLEVKPFDPKAIHKTREIAHRGYRVQVLHHIPAAARHIFESLNLEWDFKHNLPLHLNPWLMNLGKLANKLPSALKLPEGHIPSPYKERFDIDKKNNFGKTPARIDMRNASHASSNDGKVPRVYGKSLVNMMEKSSIAENLIRAWTGYPSKNKFESKLVELTLSAAITNGPGTISAQAAKLSASAGNHPNTALIATLAAIGTIHGGNGSEAAELLINTFRDSGLTDPYDKSFDKNVKALAEKKAIETATNKRKAKEVDIEFKKIPCLGHPVYKNDSINYDPRERVINDHLTKHKIYHVFLSFYQELTIQLKKHGVTSNVLAVNVDAAIACIWLGICWPLLVEKKMTVKRAIDIPFLAFAIGRAIGGAGEYLDHTDYGTSMDMRIPTSECKELTKPID